MEFESGSIPILLYHDLFSPDMPIDKTGLAENDTVVSSEQFDQHLHYLKTNGFTSISLQHLIRNRRYPKNIPPKAIVITFDDGHGSNHDLAFPLLMQHGFSATFFVVTGRIGENRHLSVPQIVNMNEAGMEFGSHSHTHRFLPLLHSSELEQELRSSKKVLENIIEKPVKAFAYPGGHYNWQVLNAVYSAGYSIGCSCLQGLNEPKTNPLLLKRLEIRRRYSMSDFQAVFDPQSIRFYQRVDFLKQMGRRILGLRNYQRIRSNLYRFYRFKR